MARMGLGHLFRPYGLGKYIAILTTTTTTTYTASGLEAVQRRAAQFVFNLYYNTFWNDVIITADFYEIFMQSIGLKFQHFH